MRSGAVGLIVIGAGCRVLGTPSVEDWPGLDELPDYNPNFPKYQAKNMADVVPGLDPQGVDLLAQMLHLDPARRISARAALQHPYFADIVAQGYSP